MKNFLIKLAVRFLRGQSIRVIWPVPRKRVKKAKQFYSGEPELKKEGE